MDAIFVKQECQEVNSYDKRDKNMNIGRATGKNGYHFTSERPSETVKVEPTTTISDAESRVTGDEAGGEVVDELANRKLCKICSVGKREINDLLIECSHVHCLYKFYHLSCLKPPLETPPQPGWYCPSCLCRVCLTDESDECVILCDGCDEGYHTYCLDPPVDRVPRGKWYCPTCQPKQKRLRVKKSSAVPKCPKPKTKASRKTKKN